MPRIRRAGGLHHLAQVAAADLLAVEGHEHRAFLDHRGNEKFLERGIVLEIDRGLAALDAIERRLGDVEVTLLDDVAHLAEEEGQQQRADVGPVDVGVGHDDDLVVTALGDVEVLAADPGAERGDEGADFGRAEHLVEAGALHVQDLAAERQDRLGAAVAALLGRAAGRIALDDEQLRLGRVAFLAVGELAGQGGKIERALAPGQLAGLARGFARQRRLDDLADNLARFGRVLLEPGIEGLADDPLDRRADLGGHQFFLGLGRELGVRHLEREDAGEPFARVFATERDFLLAGDAGNLGVLGDRAGERVAEAGQMRAAVALRDIIRKAEHGFVVGVVPLQRRLDRQPVLLVLEDDGRNERVLGAIEPVDERLEAALVVHVHDFGRRLARVGQREAHPGIEKSEFAQPVFEGGEVVLGLGERQLGGEKRHLGAGQRLALVGLGRLARDFQRRLGDAVPEANQVLAARTPDAQLQPFGQRVDHGNADPVQAARNLVGILVEFTARVELGHDDLGRRDFLLGVQIGRNAAAVIAHRDRAVAVEDHVDPVAIAGERLVDGVVHHLVDHVVEAGAVVGIADVHARALAHGIEPAQDLDRIGVIGFLGDFCGGRGLGVHGSQIRSGRALGQGFDRTLGDRVKPRPAAERFERLEIGSGQPHLGARIEQPGEQRLTPNAI